MNFLEAEDDGHGPVPMEVGAMKGKKETEARRAITTKAVRKEKKKGRKAKEKDKEKMRNQRQTRVSKATAGHVANGDTRRVSVGKGTWKPWSKFRVLSRVQWRRVQRPHRRLRRQHRLFKRSMMRMNQDGSSA